LEWRPRPTPGCSAIEEEEEDISVPTNAHRSNIKLILKLI
jgi:hypothetical protein